MIELLQIATIFERIMPDAEGRTEYHYVLVDYICRVTGGTACPADDCADLRWVAREQLPDVEPLTQGTLGVIVKAYEQLHQRSS